ncbi:hypothetical protein NE865_10090 [Phthorimaea operculella]|nr:hypothetical protein NE865_10090 [Phthorimaea operculella]
MFVTVPSTTRSQLAAEYLESCRRHNTAPIDTVLKQIRELPENAIGGSGRAARLTLANCSLGGAAPADALEALLRRARFHRLELHQAHIDDEAAEALFDMIEYYESAVTLCISGPRAFGIRGWQAASRMIKRSCQLSELELHNHPLESNHAPVLARALHAHTCRLRVLCLQHCSLTGDPLLCLGNDPMNPVVEPRVLCLQHCSLTGDPLLCLGNDPMNPVVEPRVLCLQHCSLTGDPLLCLGNDPMNPVEPRVLCLQHCSLTGDPLLCLGNDPMNPVEPRVLCLQHCSLTGDPLLCLGNDPMNPVEPRVLCLQHCSLTGDPLLCLGNDPMNPVEPRVLCLQHCSLTGDPLLCLGNDPMNPVEPRVLCLQHCSLTGDPLLCLGNDPMNPVEPRVLCLQHCSLTGDPLLCLGNDPMNPVEPRVLCLQHCSLTGDPLLCLGNDPMNPVEPRVLCLQHCSLTGDPLLCLGNDPMNPVEPRALHAHTCRLRVLCLQHCSLTGDPLLCLVIALKSNGSVRELRLGDNRLGIHDAAQLASLLRLNTLLELLDLSNNQIQDAGCGHIADALAEQAAHTPPSAAASPLSPQRGVLGGSISSYDARGLAFLVLWNNQLTRNCAHHLSRALQSQSLCVLNVGRNALGTETVRALGRCNGGSGGGALVSLGLQAARLGPDAAKPLADLITNTSLQRLDLRDNKLGSVGLQAILTAMRESNTLTQIDLDEPTESTTTLTDTSQETEGVAVARLTREIRALCCDKTPQALPPDQAPRLHRKISLTCHTMPVMHTVLSPTSPCGLRVTGPTTGVNGGNARDREAEKPREAEKRSTRLRSPLPSPAPSPAGSPVPPQQSRFSVTRVTPERELSSSSSTSSLPSYSTSPSYGTSPVSRFKVVQVAEPPQIQVGAEPRRASSRFSVTRNYDSMYNCPPDPPPTPSTPLTPPTPQTPHSPGAKDTKNVPIKDDKLTKIVPTDAKTKSDSEKIISDKETKCSDVFSDRTETVTHSESLDKGVVKTETKLVKNEIEATPAAKVDLQVQVTVKTEKPAKVHDDQNEFRDIDDIHNIGDKKKDDDAMKQIEAITEDLGNLIREMKDMTSKTVKKNKDCPDVDKIDVPANIIRDNIVLKKNKSESSLDSPDLEVSRLMMKKLEGSPFCDSSSSLEISGSSMESLAEPHIQVTKPIIIQESVESDTELDRRKADRILLSTESSLESNTSEIAPVNAGNFLNTSVSSNESVSPIIFETTKKKHDSLSSLEASVSSLDSARQDKVMVTSADSGIEYSLQNPTEGKDDTSSNEGTLTNTSSLKEVKSPCGFQVQDTLTSSPKRASSLLDVPALKTKGLDRMRKISWVAPSPSTQVQPKPEPEKVEMKLPSHLEKLLSLFQHPTSLFSRSTEEEKRSASNTPPRKDSSLTSSFWSWSSTMEKEKEEKDDLEESKDSSSEATDSTLSERVQVSFVDESFSKKLDSKTPSTDTENTLSEFQSFPTQGNSENSDVSQTDKVDKVTELTTDNLVQKSLVVSSNCMDDASSNGNKPGACDSIDLMKPNDLNRNYPAGDENKLPETDKETKEDIKEPIRPRSFAAVLKSSGSENSLDKPTSPEGQPVDKLPSKVIRGIKENISPENTLTSSMTNTKTLALELGQVKNQPIVNALWEVPPGLLEKDEAKAPIATIEETCDESADNTVSLAQLDYIDDIKFIDEKNVSADSGVTSLEGVEEKKFEVKVRELEAVDLGKDALSYLIYENQDFEPEPEHNITNVPQEGSLAQELKDAENKDKLIDLSPELVIDEAIEVPEVFVAKDSKGLRTSPVIPERAKLKKSNSLEDLSQKDDSPKTKAIAFKIPETTPRDIPERRQKLRSKSGSSPKSLPESLNKPCPLTKLDSIKKKKKVSSLGKMAKDSLLALNMTEEEIAEFRRSYKLTSVESLRSLESVSEDANSQSGTSFDSRCRACLRTSQESLMSLDSITEDCKCTDDCDKADKLARSVR